MTERKTPYGHEQRDWYGCPCRDATGRECNYDLRPRIKHPNSRIVCPYCGGAVLVGSLQLAEVVVGAQLVPERGT